MHFETHHLFPMQNRLTPDYPFHFAQVGSNVLESTKSSFKLSIVLFNFKVQKDPEPYNQATAAHKIAASILSKRPEQVLNISCAVFTFNNLIFIIIHS